MKGLDSVLLHFLSRSHLVGKSNLNFLLSLYGHDNQWKAFFKADFSPPWSSNFCFHYLKTFFLIFLFYNWGSGGAVYHGIHVEVRRHCLESVLFHHLRPGNQTQVIWMAGSCLYLYYSGFSRLNGFSWIIWDEYILPMYICMYQRI